MPETEDMVDLIVEESSESQDKGPLGETPSTQVDDAASSQEGTADVPVTPSVEELQAQLMKLQTERQTAIEGYNRERSDKDRAAAELARYREAERQQMEAQFKDKDAWIDTVTDPDKYQKFLQSWLDQKIQDQMAKRDATMQYTQEQMEAMKAMNDLREFATNEAKMDPDQLAAFLHQNSPIDPRTGQRMAPFHGYSPQEALRIAKALIRDQHFDRFAARVKEQEQKDADSKAKRQITNALPSGVPAGGGKTKEAETFGDGYRSALDQVGTTNPRDWLSH